MTLTPQMKVAELIGTYPFLLEFLAGYRPAFARLRDPILYNTLGRVATLEMAATLGGIPVERLIADLEAAIDRQGREGVLMVDRRAAPVDPARLETLKGILRDLHGGGDPAELKRRFADLLRDADPTEISRLEQQLLADGLPAEEIQRLCDVHVDLFRESLDRLESPKAPPGHPVHTYQAENRVLGGIAAELRDLCEQLGRPPDSARFEALRGRLAGAVERLASIERHYLRKEHQLFPLLEKRGFGGPGQVMWALHDGVRAMLKQLRAAVAKPDLAVVAEVGPTLARAVVDMIYKEEHILFPTALDRLDESDWDVVRRGEAEIGYAGGVLAPDGPPTAPRAAAPPDRLPLDVGMLTLDQVNLLLKNLPVDVTFVDEHDEVRYYSGGRERIFVRAPAIIGRKVQQCHPPKSLHAVERILDAFRKGKKDVAEFWIPFQGRFVHIRYVAVRDEAGAYRGTIEVTQDVAAIRALEGERRLLDWEEGTP